MPIWTRGCSRRVLLALTALATMLAACTQNDDPEGAKQLYAKVNEGAGFKAWQRAPGFPSRKPSFTAHSDEVEIWVNPTITAALAGPEPIRSWPVGSIIVKEGFTPRSNGRSLVAIMEKRADGWYWAEYSGDGDPLYSGKPTTCTECHNNRAGYSDWVYAFELPK